MSRSLPWLYWGGFCLGSSASPWQSLRFIRNTHFPRLNIFSPLLPPKCCWMVHLRQLLKGVNVCPAVLQGADPKLVDPAPTACLALSAASGSGSGRKTFGQPCPSHSQLGNLRTKCSRLRTGNKFAPCCRSETDLTHPKDCPSHSSPP